MAAKEKGGQRCLYLRLKILPIALRDYALFPISTLHSRSNELVGIIGPNGAGKTTVFNLITGVYRATEGSIYFAGNELVGMTPHQITKLGIARTFQNIRLFKELTVLDNVRIAHYGQEFIVRWKHFCTLDVTVAEEKSITDHAMELLSIFKLDDAANEQAKNLPYGLQRKLEIARALATDPNCCCLMNQPRE